MDPLTPVIRNGAARTPVGRLPLVTVVVAAGLLAAIWRLLTFSGFSNDHYVHVARAWQMLRGDWPVRDFVDPGMPLTYVLSAAGRLLFGDALRSEFIVMAAGFALGAAATAWAALRLAPSVIVAAIVVGMEIVISPRTYSSPKVLLYGFAGCAVAALAFDASRRRVLAASLLTAFAFLMRHDHGLYIGAACAMTLLVRGGPARRTATSLGWFVLGLMLLLTPWAIAVQLHGGLVPYFQLGIAFSRREADVSLLRTWPAFEPGGPMLSGANAQAWLYYFFLALPAVSVIVSWWRRRGAAPAEAAAVTGLAVLALAVHRGFIRDPLMGRLPDVIAPMALLGAWALGAAWLQSARRWTGLAARVATVVLLVPTALAVWIVGDGTKKLNDAGVLGGPAAVLSTAREAGEELSHRQVEVRRTPTRVSAALVPFFQYLQRCSAPTDRLLVTGAYADVFIAADRGFAGGQVTYQQGFGDSEADQRRILERIGRQSVPFALRIASADAIFDRDFAQVAAYVSAHYRPLADIPVGSDETVHILVDAGRAASLTDRATGWPCFVQQDPATRH